MRTGFDWNTAREALSSLIADPHDTAQVFRIIDALPGNTHRRMHARFAASARGRALLRSQAPLLDVLADRARLRAMPEGSLGRAYVTFLDREGISAEGLVQASAEARLRFATDPRVPCEEAYAYIRDRMRDQHDLWHVVTGYEGDVIGELCLLAFTFAQTGHPGIGLILGVTLLKTDAGSLGRRHILRAFGRGRRALWLPDQPWEDLLPMPLRQVRRMLQVGDAPDYVPFRVAPQPRAA